VTEIQPFTFPTTGQTVRTVVINDEPWFVASDLAAILGYRDAFNALRILEEDEKGTHPVSTPGGEQLASVVSEAGLYALALRSTLDNAKPFRRWVTHDVIPAIRKTGSYSLPREYSRLELIDMARESELARIEAENRAAYAEMQAAEFAPAARAWDALATADGDYSVGDAAKVLSRDLAIETGERRLFTTLYRLGWTYRQQADGRWRAKQSAIDIGRLSELPGSHYHPRSGELVLDAPQVRVTVKGILALHKLLGGASEVPALMSEQVAA
jgi:anti-repressor protein